MSKPAIREYQIYNLQEAGWSKPLLAENARQVVRLAETAGGYRKGVVRIVKVVATGELIEVAPLD